MRKTTPEAFVMLDEHFKITKANEAFVETFPVLSGREVRIGEHLPDLVASPLKEMMESNLKTVLEGERLEIEHVRHTENGDVSLSITHFPIKEGNKVTG